MSKMRTFSHLAEDGDFVLWPLNCLGMTVLSAVSYGVLKYYKTFDYRYSYSFYDNYYYFWYYPIMALYMLSMIFFRSTRLFHYKNRAWSLNKLFLHWVFFVETEALLEFVYSSRKIEYMVEDADGQMMVYMLMVMGIFRWALSMLSCYLYTGYLDQMADRHQIRRTRYGWVSQILADYCALHYAVWCTQRIVRNCIYHSATVPAAGAAHRFYQKMSTVQPESMISSLFFNLLDGVTLWILICLYLRYVRKEITLFSFAY